MSCAGDEAPTHGGGLLLLLLSSLLPFLPSLLLLWRHGGPEWIEEKRRGLRGLYRRKLGFRVRPRGLRAVDPDLLGVRARSHLTVVIASLAAKKGAAQSLAATWGFDELPRCPRHGLV